jgi:hypothetical protein
LNIPIVGDTVEKRGQMVDWAMSLANFQKGVGPHALHHLGFDVTKFDVSTMTGENLLALTHSNPSGKDRYDRMRPVVHADMLRIVGRIDVATSAWKKARNSTA